MDGTNPSTPFSIASTPTSNFLSIYEYLEILDHMGLICNIRPIGCLYIDFVWKG
jgi:hypothetical protein